MYSIIINFEHILLCITLSIYQLLIIHSKSNVLQFYIIVLLWIADTSDRDMLTWHDMTDRIERFVLGYKGCDVTCVFLYIMFLKWPEIWPFCEFKMCFFFKFSLRFRKSCEINNLRKGKYLFFYCCSVWQCKTTIDLSCIYL